MASVSVTHLILFIASLLVAASVAGVLTDEVGRLSEAIGDQGLDASQDIRTDVEVISDAGAGGIYDDESQNVTVYVKNTGSLDLDGRAAEIDVLIDGEYHPDLNVTVVDGDTWSRDNVARVTVENVDLDAGDHRLLVVVNGKEEVFTFRT